MFCTPFWLGEGARLLVPVFFGVGLCEESRWTDVRAAHDEAHFKHTHRTVEDDVC